MASAELASSDGPPLSAAQPAGPLGPWLDRHGNFLACLKQASGPGWLVDGKMG